MTRLASILCFMLALASCESLPALHPSEIMTTPEGAFLYDTMMLRAEREHTLQPAIVAVWYQGKEAFQLVADWSFYDGNGHPHTIPKGFVFDGASVPRWAWWWMPPIGRQDAGALPHDWIYVHKGHLPDGATFTRAEADMLLYDLLVDAGLSSTRSGLVYRAVRFGGGLTWSRPAEPVPILPVTFAMRRKLRVHHSIFAP